MSTTTAPITVDPATSSARRDAPPPQANAWWRQVASIVFRPWCRLKVEGAEHLPAHGPVIVAANHSSHTDSIALGLAAQHRALSFLGDENLLDWPILGRWLPTMGLVPVDRGSADMAALGVIAERLADGHAVVVYPEGSRTRTGSVHRPRSGVARLAAAANVPVVPVGISGTAAIWPVDGRPRLSGGRVCLRFGPPMAAPADIGRDRREFTARLHRTLVELSGAPMDDSFAPVTARGSAPASTDQVAS